MDTFLLLLAITVQAADAGLTCHRLHAGTHREVSPIYGQSCGRIVGIKAGLLIGAVQLPTRPQRWTLGAIAVGGGIGVGVALTLGK